MDKIKKMWCNLSLRKSIILYISAFVILAILLSAGTATLCNNATKTIESKYPPTGEKYYLTNENGEDSVMAIILELHLLQCLKKTNGYFQYVKLPQ